jgi:hypothetical protein
VTHPGDEHRLLLLYEADGARSPELTLPIAAWDVPNAAAAVAAWMNLAPGDPPPYAFRLLTYRRVGHAGADSLKLVRSSPTYFLGGTVRGYDELAAADGPDTPQLREVLQRMRQHNYDHVIWTNAGTTQPFLPGDEVLPDPTVHRAERNKPA